MDVLLAQIHGMPMWVQIIMAIVFLCKIITPLTPTKVDDIWFGKITPFINFLLKMVNIGGLNIGKDKNFDLVEKEVKDAKDKIPKRTSKSDVINGL